MSNRDLMRIQHMLDAAQAIQSYVKGKQKNDLEKNRMIAQAIIREFEIIGEAASAISDQMKQRLVNIPWRQMIGMRNRLIHAYFDIDYDIVWMTIEEALPSLIQNLSEALHKSTID